MANLSGELWASFHSEPLKNSSEKQPEICMESFQSISFKIDGKLVWKAPGQSPCRISLIFHMQIDQELSTPTLKQSLKEFLKVAKGVLIGLESSWSISIRKPYGIHLKTNWKLVWRASSQYLLGNRKESFSKLMVIGLESFWSTSIWKVEGVPFNIDWKLVQGAPGHSPLEHLKEFLFKINWELVCRASGQQPLGSLKEFLSKAIGNLSEERLVNTPLET